MARDKESIRQVQWYPYHYLILPSPRGLDFDHHLPIPRTSTKKKKGESTTLTQPYNL